MDYKKGSEWGRWDLHIHTPETKKNDCYTGRTPDEKWDNYYNDINSYVSMEPTLINILLPLE